MASLLTQCPHCQTTFKVSPTQLEVAHGLVRCGACLGTFSARANEVRVKSAPAENQEEDNAAWAFATLDTASTGAPEEFGPDTTDALLTDTGGDFAAPLPPFEYAPGEFASGRDHNDSDSPIRRQRRQRAAVAASPASMDHEADISFGDLQLDELDEAPLVQTAIGHSDDPDLDTLLNEEALLAEPPAEEYQEYLEYEDEGKPSPPVSPDAEDESSGSSSLLQFEEVESYDDDLELEELLVRQAPGSQPLKPPRPLMSTAPDLEDSAAPQPPASARTTSGASREQSELATDFGPAFGDHDLDESALESAQAPYEADDNEDDDDLSDTPDAPSHEDDWNAACEEDWSAACSEEDEDFTAQADEAADEAPDTEADDELDEDDDASLEYVAQSPYFADDDDGDGDGDGDSEDYEEEYDDGVEHDDEDAEPDAHQGNAGPTAQEVRQRLFQTSGSATGAASRTLLNSYLQNLEDDDALGQLPSATLNYVDDEPLTIAQAAAPRRIWSTIGLGLLNLALVALLGLQFINANLEQLNQSERFTLIRPYVCQLLTCPAPPQHLPSTLYSQQLLVRMHPRINNALEVSFIFHNDSTQAQAFPGLELSFRDNADQLVASRLFSPEQYLPPELRTVAQMPAQSSIQIQLELVDPGPQALQYSIAFREI